MIRADRKRNRLYRSVILVMWLLPLPFFVDIVLAVQSPVPLLFELLWSVPMLTALSFHKKVILTEKGIYSYNLFRNRLYPWEKIIQAGALWRMGRTERYNELVLLKQGGRHRKHQDDLFLLKNLGKTIHMEDSAEVRSYVRTHYGLLDFDLADGKREKSQVDEDLSRQMTFVD